MLKLETATHLIQFHVEDLVGGVGLAADNVQLLSMVPDLRMNVSHLVCEIVKRTAETEVGCLLPALG